MVYLSVFNYNYVLRTKETRFAPLLMKPYNMTGIRTYIKVVEKLSKYRDIEIEIERMWHSERKLFPWTDKERPREVYQ